MNQERPRPAQPLESRQDQLKQAERIVPPAPVSLGQRPEEFVAPRAPVRPQPQPQPQSQSEVDEEELVTVATDSHQKIVGLDVSMDEVLVVNKFDTPNHLELKN